MKYYCNQIIVVIQKFFVIFFLNRYTNDKKLCFGILFLKFWKGGWKEQVVRTVKNTILILERSLFSHKRSNNKINSNKFEWYYNWICDYFIFIFHSIVYARYVKPLVFICFFYHLITVLKINSSVWIMKVRPMYFIILILIFFN